MYNVISAVDSSLTEVVARVRTKTIDVATFKTIQSHTCHMTEETPETPPRHTSLLHVPTSDALPPPALPPTLIIYLRTRHSSDFRCLFVVLHVSASASAATAAATNTNTTGAATHLSERLSSQWTIKPTQPQC